MSIDPFLVWLESTPLSEWVVGSPSLLAFPGILAYLVMWVVMPRPD